jgi:two-component system, LytTR family, response regulator
MNTNLSCILIDDEPDAIEVLDKLLKLYCPQVTVAYSCATIFEGLKAIKQYQPQIVFLDIEMPGGNGLELAQEIDPVMTKIIFTTAYRNYSIHAIKVNAFDYLLKPVDPEDLKNAIIRYLQLHGSSRKTESSAPPLIKLSDKDSTLFVEPEKIMYIKAQGRYSHVILNDQRLFTVTRNIGELEEELQEQSFLRPHKSYLVNIAGIDKILNKDGGFLVLKNGLEIEIARRKRVEIIKRMSSHRC